MPIPTKIHTIITTATSSIYHSFLFLCFGLSIDVRNFRMVVLTCSMFLLGFLWALSIILWIFSVPANCLASIIIVLGILMGVRRIFLDVIICPMDFVIDPMD